MDDSFVTSRFTAHAIPQVTCNFRDFCISTHTIQILNDYLIQKLNIVWKSLCKTVLYIWKENLNIYGHQFHQYQ